MGVGQTKGHEMKTPFQLIAEHDAAQRRYAKDANGTEHDPANGQFTSGGGSGGGEKKKHPRPGEPGRGEAVASHINDQLSDSDISVKKGYGSSFHIHDKSGVSGVAVARSEAQLFEILKRRGHIISKLD